MAYHHYEGQVLPKTHGKTPVERDKRSERLRAAVHRLSEKALAVIKREHRNPYVGDILVKDFEGGMDNLVRCRT
jgi:hypothetical protein